MATSTTSTTTPWHPHRPPCLGTSTEPTLGGCYQHRKEDEIFTFPKWENTTQRRLCPANPSKDPLPLPYGPAYPRPNRNYNPCPWEERPWCCGERGHWGTEGAFLCDPPDPHHYDDPVTPGDTVGANEPGEIESGLGTSPYTNTFKPATGEVVFSPKCRKMGFKNVIAMKMWHGRHEYTTRNQSWFADWMGYYGHACYMHYYDPAPDTTKYLGMTGTAYWHIYHQTQVEPPLIDDGSATITSSLTLSKDSGQPVGWSCEPSCDVVSSTYPTFCDHLLEAAISLFGYGNDFSYTAQLVYESWMGYGMQYMYYNCGFPTSISGTHGIDFECKWELYDEDVGNYDALVVKLSNSGNTVYVKQQGPSLQPGGGIGLVTSTEFTLTYGATSMSYTGNGTGTSMQDLGHSDWSFSASLNTPYTAGDVYGDWVELMDEWDLTNDVQYPWRLDCNGAHGPKVTRAEEGYVLQLPAGCEPPLGGGPPYVSVWADGSIRGSPHNLHGARIWDDLFQNWREFTRDDGGKGWCLDSYGSSSSYDTPWSATQWTNKNDVKAYTIPYAFLRADPSSFGIPILIGAKWAEILIKRPSMNWARPCGADRFQVHAWSSGCIQVVDMDDPTKPIITLDPSYTFSGGDPTTNYESGDYCYVCGREEPINGIWKIDAKLDPRNVRLVNDRVPGADYPIVSEAQMMKKPYEQCGTTGMISKLRWPFSDPAVRPYCSTIYISNIDASVSPVVITLQKPTALATGDYVTLQNITGFVNNPYPSGYNDYWQITAIDPKTFSLNGSTASTRTWTGGGSLVEPWGGADYWDDTTSKGEYCIKEWNTNFRDVGEYNRIKNRNIELPTQSDVCVLLDSDTCDADCPMCSNLIPPVDEPRHWLPYHGVGQEVTSIECGIHCNPGKPEMCNPCLPAKPCCPSVVCISPNGEEFENGATYGFPGFTIDDVYGSAWAMEVRQDMYDPFYQFPPCSCKPKEEDLGGDFDFLPKPLPKIIPTLPPSTTTHTTTPDGEKTTTSTTSDTSTGTTTTHTTVTVPDRFDQNICRQDDGNCHENAMELMNPEGYPPIFKYVEYYAHGPMVECICVPPPGAPALPPFVHDVNIGCLSVDQLNQETAPPGNACMYKSPGWGYECPHQLYLPEVACDCRHGRFWQEYEADYAFCDDNQVVAAP